MQTGGNRPRKGRDILSPYRTQVNSVLLDFFSGERTSFRPGRAAGSEPGPGRPLGCEAGTGRSLGPLARLGGRLLVGLGREGRSARRPGWGAACRGGRAGKGARFWGRDGEVPGTAGPAGEPPDPEPRKKAGGVAFVTRLAHLGRQPLFLMGPAEDEEPQDTTGVQPLDGLGRKVQGTPPAPLFRATGRARPRIMEAPPGLRRTCPPGHPLHGEGDPSPNGPRGGERHHFP